MLMFNKHTFIFKCCHTTSKNTFKLLAENNIVACCINFVKLWSNHYVSVWARCSLVHKLITHIFPALACMFDNSLFIASFLGFSYVIRFFFLADCLGGTCTSLPWSIIMTHQKTLCQCRKFAQIENVLMFDRYGVSKFEISPQFTSSYLFATLLVPLDWLIANLCFGLNTGYIYVDKGYWRLANVMLYLIFVNQDRW